jgi:DNA-binding winged helix-turn-helix (wHTH) protein
MPGIDALREHRRIFRVGIVEYDEARQELRVQNQQRAIEGKPRELLYALLLRHGEVVTKNELIAAAWSDGLALGDSSLTTAIGKLRAALGEARDIIKVVPGVGYRIQGEIGVAASHAPAPFAFSFAPGDCIPGRPQWRMERRLGEAPGNEVWLARHEKTREARVFKFADTASRLDALRRETSLARLLQETLGPREEFVRVLEWNFAEQPYYIESPYRGPDLLSWANETGLAAFDQATRLGLAAQAARIVATAHGAGVLHGDIKPANILVVSESGEMPRICLIDFGAGDITDRATTLAFGISGLSQPASGRTGTLRYMAPEMLKGGPPTTSADIYSLGVLLYQLAVADFGKSLDVGWEADIEDPILRKDIADAALRDQDRRLSSAAALAERLETLELRRDAARREAEARAASADMAAQLERARARHPWVAASAALLAGGLLLAIFLGLDAARQRDEARREAGIARAVNQFLTIDLLGRGDPSHSGKADETLMQAAEKAEPQVAYRLAKEPLVAGSIYLALAAAFEGRSAFKEARAAYDKADAAYATVERPNSADALILMLRRANMEALSGEPGSAGVASGLIARAQPALPRLGDRRAEAVVWLMTARASLDNMAGDQTTAQREILAAADMADTLPDVFDEDFRLVLRQRLAVVTLRLGEVDQANTLLTRLLQRQLALHGPNYPDTLLVESTMARVMLLRNQFEQASALLDRLYPDMVAVFGTANRQTLIALSLRAQARIMLGRYDEAVEDDKLVYQATTGKQGALAFLALAAQGDAASAECRKGDGQAGLHYALNAYDGASKSLGETSGFTQIISATAALCLIQMKEFTQADMRLRGIQAATAGKFDASTPEQFHAELDLLRAAVANEAGDTSRARSLLSLPRRHFAQPDADPFLFRWTHQLASSLDPPGSQH